MVSVMNDYVNRIKLVSDDITKAIFETALNTQECIAKHSILIKSNRYIVDIHLKEFSVEQSVHVMNYFMENSRYHYSAYFIRFNEGNMVRYRYASCKETKEGFYCDVIIS